VAESAFVVFFWVVLAATAATARHNGKAAPEKVATLTHRDIDCAEKVSRPVIRRSSRIPLGEEVVLETYLPVMQEGPLALSRRVRRISTMTTEGSRIVEETEMRSEASLGEPMRVVQRSVTTVRTDGSGGQITEQHQFELDVNGRFVPVRTLIEQKSRR
jgi:hypothetical protein